MTHNGWEGFPSEDLRLGAVVEAARVVGEADVQAFAAVSGDFIPLHLDEAYAARTLMKGRAAPTTAVAACQAV